MQNAHYFDIHKETSFEETLKLDGSSLTAYKVKKPLTLIQTILRRLTLILTLGCKPSLYPKDHFGVCSRNQELPNDGNNFWSVMLKHEVDKYLPRGYALQGELVGPKIQSNHEKMEHIEFFTYDVYNIDEERYLTPAERKAFLKLYLNDVPHVPISAPDRKLFINNPSYDEIQKQITSESMNPGTVSEGRVYKSHDGKTTFKAISSEYLLKGGN